MRALVLLLWCALIGLVLLGCSSSDTSPSTSEATARRECGQRVCASCAALKVYPTCAASPTGCTVCATCTTGNDKCCCIHATHCSCAKNPTEPTPGP